MFNFSPLRIFNEKITKLNIYSNIRGDSSDYTSHTYYEYQLYRHNQTSGHKAERIYFSQRDVRSFTCPMNARVLFVVASVNVYHTHKSYLHRVYLNKYKFFSNPPSNVCLNLTAGQKTISINILIEINKASDTKKK